MQREVGEAQQADEAEKKKEAEEEAEAEEVGRERRESTFIIIVIIHTSTAAHCASPEGKSAHWNPRNPRERPAGATNTGASALGIMSCSDANS